MNLFRGLKPTATIISRYATAYDDLAFLAFFAPWRLGVLKMNSHTAAKGGPTST